MIRKSILPAYFILLFWGVSSCKKDYTCTCTLDARQQNHQYSSSQETFIYTDVTHGQAKRRCNKEAENYNSTSTLNYMHDCGL